MTTSDDWRHDLSADTRPEFDAPRAWIQDRVPCLTVLFHDDLGRVGEVAMLGELISGREVAISRLEPSFGGPGRPRRPLADPHLSRRPWHLRRLQGDDGYEIDGSATSTPLVVDGSPAKGARRLPATDLEHGVVIQLAESVVLLLHRRHPVPNRQSRDYDLVGESDALLQVRRDIDRIASLDVPVLLRGETGTGKEMVARAIHSHGSRASGPLVCVNMAAVPPSLAAAELFGAVRGAYTGAVAQRFGYFQQADGGTLFLDEIGETPEDVQPLLLRALETGEIQGVGSDRRRHVDVRLIAATDAELENRIAQGRFRAPLLHRLAGYDLRLPPLRQRREDIGRLFFHFLRLETEAVGDDPLPEGAIAWLRGTLFSRLAVHDWPGNVRQLRNLVRQLVIIGHQAAPGELAHRLDELLSAEVDSAAQPGEDRGSPEARAATSPRRTYRRPSEVDEEELLAALRANSFRILPTAESLGLSRTSLYHLIDRSPRVRKPADLRREELIEVAGKLGGSLTAMAESLEVSRPGLEQRLRQLDLQHLLGK